MILLVNNINKLTFFVLVKLFLFNKDGNNRTSLFPGKSNKNSIMILLSQILPNRKESVRT